MKVGGYKRQKSKSEEKKMTKKGEYPMNTRVEFNTHIIPFTEMTSNKPKGKLIIWYHAKWCGHCINMEEHWKRLKQEGAGKDIHFVELEESQLDHLLKHHTDHVLSKYVNREGGFPQVMKVTYQKGGAEKIEPYEKWYDANANKPNSHEHRTTGSFLQFLNAR